LVTEEVVQDHRRVTGSLQAVSRSAVAAQESGLVRTVLVDEGDVVRSGDVIATLDARRLTAQLAEARAEHANQEAIAAQREAELRFAELDAARVRAAHAEGAANDRELSEVETLLDVRRSQRDAATKAVDRAVRGIDLLEIRLEDMTLRAPFDARVVARHVEPGEWINPGQPVVTLVSTGLIEARLEVPERFAPAVLGMEREIVVELGANGRTARSIKVRPVADIDPRARTFQVFVTLDNSAGLMAPGMSVQAWVPTTEQATALLAPKDAVIRNQGEAYVFRVLGNGSEPEAEKTPVRVLFTWKDRLAIAPGALSPGDTVVIEGNERLAPGMPLRVSALDARNN
jgi:RND family efflux transporter MFP subunit